ncbi:MAG TPA: F0F1 ATP synthase subunit delta [Candidatus Saccharimonadales bacterium]|nr:F0F1 ATP synthase subunit delta [Candidatus Saccharimonadales bacterium]
MEPLKLPPSIVGQVDIIRLSRELSALSDFFVGAQARESGTPVQPPQTSRSLELLAKENGISLLDEKSRDQLLKQLEEIGRNAPSFHISFAVEASPKSLERILVWLRQNIHPQVLLQVGLQPAIAGGCILRTTNRILDLSLRSKLNSETEYLSKLISGAVNG